MSLVEELTALGIAEDVAEAAAAQCETLDAALDWIAANQGGAGAPTTEESSAEKTILVCSDCGRKFGTVELAQIHASQEGHEAFEEEAAKALSPEERAARMAVLREKLAARREAREREDAEEAIKREMIRRKSGVVAQEARAEMRNKAALQAADDARRQRAEDQATLRRIREEMAAERAARQRARDNVAIESSVVPAPPETEAVSAPTTSDKVRLQIKLPCGRAFRGVFLPTDTFATVLEVMGEAGMSVPAGHSLVVPLPHRVVDHAGSETLEALGLCPSATLLVERL